jgi:hypothetical protein
VVAMPWRARDIRGPAIGSENARQHIDRGQQLKCAIDGGSTNPGRFGDDLLGGEGPVVLQNRVNHGPARLGQAVAMIGKELADPGGGGKSSHSVFDSHLVPIAWWRVRTSPGTSTNHDWCQIAIPGNLLGKPILSRGETPVTIIIGWSRWGG